MGRDVKLENTLLDQHLPLPNVKLCDFGYSKNEFIDSRPKTVSGTPDYIAPEVLLHDNYSGKTADIWSCGVVLYVMLTGVPSPGTHCVPHTQHSCCHHAAGGTCAPEAGLQSWGWSSLSQGCEPC